MNNRRTFIELTTMGVLGTWTLDGRPNALKSALTTDNSVHDLYPTTHYSEISAVVGACHSNLDRVRELVNKKPELAKATWDWGFGDVESALGAASHMGRKDIADYLIDMGARPDIYTFAMLGKVDAVKAMIEAMPGIQSILGPHGFTLMHHATIRLRRKNVEGSEKVNQEELVAYLESLGNADEGQMSQEITEQEKEKYLGKYQFGNGENDYFEAKLNMRKMLSLSRGDTFGRGLNKVGENTFAPGGAPSVRIKFELSNDRAKTVSIFNPELVISAERMA